MSIQIKITYMEHAGERIKKKRKELGYTQAEVGKLVGVTSVAVVQWEKGDTLPSGAHLLILAKALDVSPEYILGTDQKQTKIMETRQKYRTDNLRPEQVELLDAFDQVDKPLRKAVLKLLRAGK